MRGRFWRGAAVGVVLGVLAGCGGRDSGIGQTDEGGLVLGEAEQTATETRGVRPGNRTLVLDGFRGTVLLEGTEDENATLNFTKQARGRTDEDARRLLDRITFEETGDAETYRYVLRSGDANLSQVDVEGTVPRSTPIEIRLESGVVRLSGLDGPLRVRLENGNIDIGGAGQNVEAETRNGSVAAGFYRLASGATVRLQSTNGNVALTLPASAQAAVEARTAAGEVRVEGLDFSGRRLSPDGAGSRFQGQLGQGGATVALRTENGLITLSEGTVTRLPDDMPEADVPSDTDAAPADTSQTAPSPFFPDTTSRPAI